jgi:hypothetical protein
MGKKTVSAAAAAVFAVFTYSAFAAEESVFTIGGVEGWTSIVRRLGIAEISGVRKLPALAISSARPIEGDAQDLALSFDERAATSFADAAGRWRTNATASVSIAGPLHARAGAGAALFSAGVTTDGISGITVTPERDALFAPGERVGDFSIEFWLFPANMESGEQILSWTSSRRTPSGESVFQRIRCTASRNRLEWTFSDFFASADEGRRLTVTLTPHGTVLPREWSHHLVRFDAETGLLEYLVDGALEDTAYATVSGNEGGEVFAPVMGSGGFFLLGPRYTGFMDEFRLYRSFLERPVTTRYPTAGGRAESRFIDLGTTNARIIRIEAEGSSAADGSEFRLFIRAGDSPYGWDDAEESWIPVRAGSTIGGSLRGRWAQIAVVLYPSGDGENTPYLDEIRIVYERDEPPPPPSLVIAKALDSAVELRWRASPDPDLGGYLLYYGEAKGEYFGEAATAGPSPLDVGNRTSIIVDGLRNGTLYYFAVAAYDGASPRHIGEFSREVSARPARTER